MAPKIVKFNKPRHKKSQWITKGIVKKNSYRDKLYKQYRTTPTNTDAYDIIKINLNTCNKNIIIKYADGKAKSLLLII